MLVLKILLGVLAAWSLISHIALFANRNEKLQPRGDLMASTLTSTILALGFLGLILINA